MSGAELSPESTQNTQDYTFAKKTIQVKKLFYIIIPCYVFSDPCSITISYSTGNMQQTTSCPIDVIPEKLLDARYELFDDYANITF